MLHRLLAALTAPVLLAACATGPLAEQTAIAQGVVEAADPRAAEAGRSILAEGGSATDAAIAVMLALTVVEPQSSGIGGGGFAVLGLPDGFVTTFDGRETAPAAAGPDWFLNPDGTPQSSRDVVRTGLSVGVPGNIAMAAKMHARYGRLPWAALFAPAIALADEGFIVNPRLHDSLEGMIERAGLAPEMRAIFYQADGSPIPVGSRIRRPELAETFRALAAQGPGAMYGEEAALALASHIAANTPGSATMQADDITGYVARERPATCGTYRLYRICGMGPPSSGAIAVVQILGQLERFDLAALGPQSLTAWHLFLQSQLLAYADRELYVGDPDFVSVPVEGLTETGYLAQRALLIEPGKALGTYPAGTPAGALARADGDEPVESGTTHFVAVDNTGAMVSYTSTVEGAFGSGLQFGGYHLNNELTDFSFSPVRDGRPVANSVAGSKRPRSSMSPMLVWDPQGQPFMVIGGAGGPFIPVQTARTLMGVIDFGLPLKEAMGLPLVMGFGTGLYVESDSWLAGEETAFRQLGYERVRIGPQPFGSVGQVGAILQDGVWVSAVDPRFDGKLSAP